jgi:hypothetical protein
MHKALALLWCSGLAAADIGQLEQLADKNRFFELRRDLQQPGWNDGETLFYRAVVASRWTRVRCQDPLKEFDTLYFMPKLGHPEVGLSASGRRETPVADTGLR